MKKLFLYSLLVSLLLSPIESSLAFEPYFNDVDDSNPNLLAIETLHVEDVLQGYDNGNFEPEQMVNRAELMKILVAGQKIIPELETYNNCYPDVTTDWYAPYVCYATEQGWVSGYPDGTFLPSQTVNKAEAAKMLVNALELMGKEGTLGNESFDDVSSSDWFEPYVQTAYSLNLFEEDGAHFNPAGDRDRGSIAESMFRGIGAKDGATFDNDVRNGLLEEADLSDLIPNSSNALAVFQYHTDGENYVAENDGYIEDNDGIIWVDDFSTGALLRVAKDYALEDGEITVDADDLLTDEDGVVSLSEYSYLNTESLVVFIWEDSSSSPDSTTDLEEDVTAMLTDNTEFCLELLTEALSYDPFDTVNEAYLSCEMKGFIGYAEAIHGEYADYDILHDYGSYSMGVDQYLDLSKTTRFDFGFLRVTASYENPTISEYSDPLVYDYLILVSMEGTGEYSYIEETVQSTTYESNPENDYEYYLAMSGPNGSDSVAQTEWSGYSSILGVIDEEGVFSFSLPIYYMEEQLELSGTYTQSSQSYRGDELVDSSDYETEKNVAFEDSFRINDYSEQIWSDYSFDYEDENSYSETNTVVDEATQTAITDYIYWYFEPIN